MYEEGNDFSFFCGQIDALTFLPINEARHDGVADIRDTIPDEAITRIDYFDSTNATEYFRKFRQVRHHGVPILNIRRILLSVRSPCQEEHE